MSVRTMVRMDDTTAPVTPGPSVFVRDRPPQDPARTGMLAEAALPIAATP